MLRVASSYPPLRPLPDSVASIWIAPQDDEHRFAGATLGKAVMIAGANVIGLCGWRATVPRGEGGGLSRIGWRGQAAMFAHDLEPDRQSCAVWHDMGI